MRAETEDGHGASRHAREMNASRVLRVPFSEEIDLIQISRLRGKFPRGKQTHTQARMKYTSTDTQTEGEFPIEAIRCTGDYV